MARIPCTGGAGKWPIFDRHDQRIHVGDILRVQHCVGRYGQTKISEVTVQNAHWDYCQEGVARTDYDHQRNALLCRHTHNDFEHGHETWAEIIGQVVPSHDGPAAPFRCNYCPDNKTFFGAPATDEDATACPDCGSLDTTQLGEAGSVEPCQSCGKPAVKNGVLCEACMGPTETCPAEIRFMGLRWTLEQTGGGCTAYRATVRGDEMFAQDDPTQPYMLMTRNDDASAPDAGNEVIIVLYFQGEFEQEQAITLFETRLVPEAQVANA